MKLLLRILLVLGVLFAVYILGYMAVIIYVALKLAGGMTA